MTNQDNSKELINIPVKWIVSFLFLALGILIGFFLWNSGSLGLTGNVVSENQAEKNIINFFENEVPGSEVEVISVTKQGSLYEFVLDVDGDSFPVYITTDGKYLVIDPIPLG